MNSEKTWLITETVIRKTRRRKSPSHRAKDRKMYSVRLTFRDGFRSGVSILAYYCLRMKRVRTAYVNKQGRNTEQKLPGPKTNSNLQIRGN